MPSALYPQIFPFASEPVRDTSLLIRLSIRLSVHLPFLPFRRTGFAPKYTTAVSSRFVCRSPLAGKMKIVGMAIHRKIGDSTIFSTGRDKMEWTLFMLHFIASWNNAESAICSKSIRPSIFFQRCKTRASRDLPVAVEIPV